MILLLITHQTIHGFVIDVLVRRLVREKRWKVVLIIKRSGSASRKWRDSQIKIQSGRNIIQRIFWSHCTQQIASAPFLVAWSRRFQGVRADRGTGRTYCSTVRREWTKRPSELGQNLACSSPVRPPTKDLIVRIVPKAVPRLVEKGSRIVVVGIILPSRKDVLGTAKAYYGTQ